MLKSLNVKIMVLLLSSLMMGCATQRVYVKGDLTGPPDYEETQGFWLGGIGQETEVNASAVCKTKNKRLSRVEIKQTMKNVLVTGVTLGIYAPRTVRISCK